MHLREEIGFMKNDYSFVNKVQTLKNSNVFSNVLVISKSVQRFSQKSISTNAFYSKISLPSFQVNRKEILFVFIQNNL